MIAHKFPRRAMMTTVCLLILGCSSQQSTFATSFDGARINYVVKGEGSPTLVFVHGWLADMAVWEPQVKEFSLTNTVVALDLPGHGKSSLVRAEWTMTNFGQDVATLIRQLALNEVILVGHSMGSAVVLETAIRLPDKVVGVVVVDSFKDVEKTFTDEEIYNRINANSPAFAQLIRNNPYYVTAKSGWIGSYSDYLHWHGNGLVDGLRALRVPIYAINSDQGVTDIEMARKYAPSFNARIIEGVGHVIMIEAPEKFNTNLREIMTEWTVAATDPVD